MKKNDVPFKTRECVLAVCLCVLEFCHEEHSLTGCRRILKCLLALRCTTHSIVVWILDLVVVWIGVGALVRYFFVLYLNGVF
jgi:hypothetical protein